MSRRRTSRIFGDGEGGPRGSRELAAALVRAEGGMPAELEGMVLDALAELLELAESLRELPLESINPIAE